MTVNCDLSKSQGTKSFYLAKKPFSLNPGCLYFFRSFPFALKNDSHQQNITCHLPCICQLCCSIFVCTRLVAFPFPQLHTYLFAHQCIHGLLHHHHIIAQPSGHTFDPFFFLLDCTCASNPCLQLSLARAFCVLTFPRG